MAKQRTPEQREAIKFAYWNKWGGDPKRVIRTKGITKDDWQVTKITSPELDNDITKVV